MPKIYDLVVGSTYTSKQTNQEKTRWTRIGTMREKENGQGFTIFLDALPMTNIVQVFEQRERQDNSQNNPPQEAGQGQY